MDVQDKSVSVHGAAVRAEEGGVLDESAEELGCGVHGRRGRRTTDRRPTAHPT
jgi:hypothetical protein